MEVYFKVDIIKIICKSWDILRLVFKTLTPYIYLLEKDGRGTYMIACNRWLKEKITIS